LLIPDLEERLRDPVLNLVGSLGLAADTDEERFIALAQAIGLHRQDIHRPRQDAESGSPDLPRIIRFVALATEVFDDGVAGVPALADLRRLADILRGLPGRLGGTAGAEVSVADLDRERPAPAPGPGRGQASGPGTGTGDPDRAGQGGDAGRLQSGHR
jgi:hypothetical protein